MAKLLNYTPYLLALATIVIAAIDLMKDWDGYKNSWLKRGKAAVMCIFAALTFASLHQDSLDKQTDQVDRQKLEARVEAANTAQRDNTVLYLKTYKDIMQEITDLKSQVRSEALQKKLASVQDQLEATQKALLPGPKAKLAFTFWPFINPALGSGLPAVPSVDKILPVDPDGNVHIDFSVLNLTEVDALDGDITLAICDQCKYAKEPVGFHKVAGDAETERVLPFERLLGKAFLATMSIDILPPASSTTVPLGISFRCRTCVIPTTVSSGTVHLRRDFVKPY